MELPMLIVLWTDPFIPHDGKGFHLKPNAYKMKWSGRLIGYRKNIWGRLIGLILRRDNTIVEVPMKKVRVMDKEEVCLKCGGGGYKKDPKIYGNLILCDNCKGDGIVKSVVNVAQQLTDSLKERITHEST